MPPLVSVDGPSLVEPSVAVTANETALPWHKVSWELE
jgi:hypothetical protein